MNKEELELVRCDLHNAYSWLNAQEQENKQLKERIDKAIEYIKNNDFHCKNQYEQEKHDEELLEILGDKENE